MKWLRAPRATDDVEILMNPQTVAYVSEYRPADGHSWEPWSEVTFLNGMTVVVKQTPHWLTFEQTVSAGIS